MFGSRTRTRRRNGTPIGTERTDTELINRVRAGDHEAYAELVRRHASMARRTAVLIGAGSDADDVVQESLVKAYRALGEFREGADFRPWLLKIVVYETRNTQRAVRRRAARERAAASLSADLIASGAEAADPAVSALSYERRLELLAALRKLSDQHRLVLTCRYLLDLDVAETATVLGWPRGTVKSRVHRALRRLRTELGVAAQAYQEHAQAKEADRAKR